MSLILVNNAYEPTIANGSANIANIEIAMKSPLKPSVIYITINNVGNTIGNTIDRTITKKHKYIASNLFSRYKSSRVFPSGLIPAS